MKSFLAMWRETPHLAALFTLIGIGWLFAGGMSVLMVVRLILDTPR